MYALDWGKNSCDRNEESDTMSRVLAADYFETSFIGVCPRCGEWAGHEDCPRDPSKCQLCHKDAHIGRCEEKDERA